MRVVSAGVHDADCLRLIGLAGGFLNGQRVHVGAQGDHFARAGFCAADEPQHADFGVERLGFHAHFLQFGPDEGRRFEFVHSQLGVTLDYALTTHEIIAYGAGFFQYF